MRGLTQRKYGGERKRRRSYAEVAEGIPKLFGKGLNQCLCGLQGINGWEGAWGLVVCVFAAWLGAEAYGGERKRRRSYAEVAKVIPKLFGKGLNQCLCGLQGINGWEGAWGLVVCVFAALLGAQAYGGERKRRRSYAEVAEEIPKYLKSLANSIRPLSPRQARNPSFPRRRESTAALLMTMDYRPAPLRGKLGQVDLSRAFLRGAALWAVGCQGKGIRQKTVARLLAVLAQWRGRVRAVASSSGSWRGRAGVVCG